MAVPQAGVEISKALSTPGSRKSGAMWAGVLEDAPLFAGVPKRHVRKIAALTREARFGKGTAIVTAGEPGNDFFIVLDGVASVLRPDGLRPIEIGPGSCFGEMSLIDGGERTATVVATSDVLCLRLSRAPFQKMLKNEPAIALALLQEFAGRIRELQARAHLT